MSSAPKAGNQKVCTLCRKTATDRPRVKDRKGRYYHKDCFQRARQKAQARKRAAASAPAPRKPAPAVNPAVEPSSLDDLLLLEASASALDFAAPPPTTASGGAAVAKSMCPGCGATMPLGSVVCINCGLNVSTGKKMKAAKAKKAKKPKKAGDSGESLASQPWIFGAGAAAFFLIFYAVAKSSEDVAGAYALATLIFGLGAGICILVKAYGESSLHGTLCLFVPIYSLYFVFAVNDNRHLKIAYGVSVLAYVLLLTLGDTALLPIEQPVN